MRGTIQPASISEASTVANEGLLNGRKVLRGDQWTFFVNVKTRSKDIAYSNTSSPSVGAPVTGSRSEDGFTLGFNDESLARRVEAALVHAADLCRMKGPF